MRRADLRSIPGTIVITAIIVGYVIVAKMGRAATRMLKSPRRAH